MARDEKRRDPGEFYPGGKVWVKPGQSQSQLEGAVQYDREQTLTDAQKEQVQKNIGTLGKLPMRPLPKYLHYLKFDDTYPADAEAFYATIGGNRVLGGCSIVRKGGIVGGNFDYPYDDSCSFAIKVSAGKGANTDGSDRHASVGAAYLGTRLTENFVSSGVNTPLYRVLPGMTESGINDAGVYAKINVIPRDESKDPAQSSTRTINALAVVRYVLDHFDNAADAATYIAANYYIPDGSVDSYHWMIADENGTYIIEDGAVISTETTLTNHRNGTDTYGSGYSRDAILAGSGTVSELLSAVKFTNAYADGWPWSDEFAGQEDADGKIPHTATDRLKAWADVHVAPLLDANRKPASRGNWCWQTVHSCIYDFEKKTMAICVQEDFSKRYTFAAASSGGASVEFDAQPTEGSQKAARSGGIWSWVTGLLSPITSAISALTSSVSGLASSKLDGPTDTTLTQSGKAADAAETGAALDLKYSKYSDIDLSNSYSIDNALDVHTDALTVNSSTELNGDVSVNAELKMNENDITGVEDIDASGDVSADGKVSGSRGQFGNILIADDDITYAVGKSIKTLDVEVQGKYAKPTGGIPARDLAPGVIHALVAPSESATNAQAAAARAVYDFVNSSINAMAAFYITKNEAGDSFATKAELNSAISSGTFYNGGQPRTPTKNDYLYILADESHPTAAGTSPTTRYSFDGTQWAFQIVVNDTALTAAQLAAMNSGITAALVTWLTTFKGTDSATTLAFILAKLAHLESDGTSDDDFATDLFGKQVAKAKVRYKLSTVSSTTMSDRTTNFLQMNGNATLTFPEAIVIGEEKYSRDFLLRVKVTTAGSLTLPVDIALAPYSDDFDFTKANDWLIAFTEEGVDANGKAEFYIRAIG